MLVITPLQHNQYLKTLLSLDIKRERDVSSTPEPPLILRLV